MVFFETLQLIMVLLNFALDGLNLLVHLLESVFLVLLLLQLIPLLLLLLLLELVVETDERNEVHVIFLQLLLGHVQGMVAALLFELEVFDFFIDGVVCKLGQEHFLLLVDELVDVLTSVLFRVLEAGASDVHGGTDDASLALVVAEQLFFFFSR